ncbi:hypothetical protein CLV24_104241 [Pontibacter ummariensis]|uniref:Uncharacterized protein n=1 Tax=Pontibacter ummariensis TaxID=1610492 RepID=A0A239DH01_9BACT|nr:hypothetical protein CLV24_104241 [Pontibacter ummariensis]SNS31765.1 hypothetical protein SAMN06296052_104240 [Pontibacter ummariensis]
MLWLSKWAIQDEEQLPVNRLKREGKPFGIEDRFHNWFFLTFSFYKSSFFFWIYVTKACKASVATLLLFVCQLFTSCFITFANSSESARREKRLWLIYGRSRFGLIFQALLVCVM